MRGLRQWTSVLVAIVFLAIAPGALAAEPEPKAKDEPPPPRSTYKGLQVGPRLSIHGFADITLSARYGAPDDPDDESRDQSAFVLGEFDLFFVSRLTKSVSFLAEVVLEYEENDEIVADIERLFVKYDLSDKLALSLGRRHTPLGYWNETYHHGLLLQPTVHRPEVLKFEDKGGILPVHTVGGFANGEVFTGSWGVGYYGGIGNGRGPTRTQIQTTQDANDDKAIVIKGTATKQMRRSSFLFGIMGYRDEIPPAPELPGREGSIDERILGAHFVYENPKLKVWSEYYFVRHHDNVSSRTFDSPGYYAIAQWRQWRWKPYGGYDRLDVDPDDPYYDGLVPITRYLGGVRFDVNPFNAIKFEYRHEIRPEETVEALDVQFSLTF